MPESVPVEKENPADSRQYQHRFPAASGTGTAFAGCPAAAGKFPGLLVWSLESAAAGSNSMADFSIIP